MEYRVFFIVRLLFLLLAPYPVLAASAVLPEQLSGSAYFQYLADLLGWRDNQHPDRLCRGGYSLPSYIKKNPQIDRNASIQITAEGPETLKLDGVSELQDNIVIQQAGQLIHADKALIFRNDESKAIEKVVLSGLVRIYQGKSLLICDQATITLNPRKATISQLAYHYTSIGSSVNAWGTAKKGVQTADQVTTLQQASYSTCPLNSIPAWQISAGKIVLDKAHNIGKAYNALLRVKNIPVLYSPYYSFQLNGQRKTGLLTPVYGHNTDSGNYLGLPIYFNLAPNYDLTLTPQYYGDRGFKANASFRYLSESSQGHISASILPNDTLFGEFRQNAINTYSQPPYNPIVYQPYLEELESENNLRGMLVMENHSTFSPTLNLRYYINLVSDPYYLSNITSGSIINDPLANDLLNLLQLQYSNSTWDSSAYLETYQTLHLITQIQDQAQVLDQYSRYPSLNAYHYKALNNYFASQFSSDFNYFTYDNFNEPDKPTGARLHLRPGLLMTLQNSTGYIKPQIWLDNVIYSLSDTNETSSANTSRTLPILDIDSGLHFFREFQWGEKTYQQSLEPRLFYLYVPYKNQDDLPNFDTIQLPFFFDQLFSLNTFEGVDRIENANQVSLGVTSRIISHEQNRQLLSFDLGSIYYLDQPKVCLTSDCSIKTRHFSPIITDFSFHPSKEFALSTSYAWDPETHETNNASFGLAYHRDTKRVLNLSYVFVGANDNSLSTFSSDSEADQYTNNSSHLVASAAWPLSERWSILGQSDYNLDLERLDTLYAGLEYNSCCWQVRFVVQELFDSSTVSASDGSLENNYNTGYFIQINLKGLASFGTGGNGSIRSAIPGYNTEG